MHMGLTGENGIVLRFRNRDLYKYWVGNFCFGYFNWVACLVPSPDNAFDEILGWWPVVTLLTDTFTTCRQPIYQYSPSAPLEGFIPPQSTPYHYERRGVMRLWWHVNIFHYKYYYSLEQLVNSKMSIFVHKGHDSGVNVAVLRNLFDQWSSRTKILTIFCFP